jgi:hypothetical protein
VCLASVPSRYAVAVRRAAPILRLCASGTPSDGQSRRRHGRQAVRLSYHSVEHVRIDGPAACRDQVSVFHQRWLPSMTHPSSDDHGLGLEIRRRQRLPRGPRSAAQTMADRHPPTAVNTDDQATVVTFTEGVRPLTWGVRCCRHGSRRSEVLCRLMPPLSAGPVTQVCLCNNMDCAWTAQALSLHLEDNRI